MLILASSKSSRRKTRERLLVKILTGPHSHRLCRLALVVLLSCAALLSFGACGNSHNSASSVRAIDDYCPYLPSKTFPGEVAQVSGHAFYQSRSMGNGSVTDGNTTFHIAGAYSNSKTYAVSIGSAVISASNQGTELATLHALVAQINASGIANQVVQAATGLDAYGNTAIRLSLIDSKKWLDYSSITNLIQDGGNPNPIRFAEVRIQDAQGNLVQCAETTADGSFNFQLPKDGGQYSVSVASRAANAHNTAFVMNDPNGNVFYQISANLKTTNDVRSIWLAASARGTLEGGAFNILDQIMNAQEYLRAKTLSCTRFDPNCQPFTSAPIIHVYWTPGLTPGIYYGITGAISYYLNGKKELYLQGGLNGDTTYSDQDQFDNSVIIHEYGHFIEDQFGSPNSPGGSHNGDAVIDPRLAWGEGWADFFQAAVTGYPYYRDTIGNVDCDTINPASCTYVSFSEPIDTPKHDIPGTTGEGNYREFSVARELYSATLLDGSDPVGEIWAVMHGSQSMRSSNDPYKSIGRFHSLQRALGGREWSTLRANEKQWGDLTHYGQTVAVGSSSCSTSPVTMHAVHSSYDDGSFEMSNMFNNNHFYRFDHGGGAFTLTLSYDKSTNPAADLDLYVYRAGYVYGNSTDIVAHSNEPNDRNPSNPSQGIETIQQSLPAGTYMINVMAFTGSVAATNQYSLSLNGQILCPQ